MGAAVLVLAASLAADPAASRGKAAASYSVDAVRFNRDVRPILSDHCFACHGPDAEKRKGKLRLDTKQGLFNEREGKAPVVPGDKARSELVRRVFSSDPDDVMPPAKGGKPLSDAQKTVLEQWVKQGAPWEGHWAYTPVERPALPKDVSRADRLNPVDAFILSRLGREHLKPASEADSRTLARRVSWDLTGLPASPDDVRRFEKDDASDAYERMVDRLLNKPAYGERMAVYWLDLARYADTDGFHADNYRSVYPYRDYVIRSFTENMPFDRFTREQLAGDLLPDATIDQRVASTFNRLGRTTEEGGAQPKEYLSKYASERVRAVANVWLGSTMGCAECHDHKFDPFTTRDFYRMESFFADIKEVGVGKPEEFPVLNASQQREKDSLEERIASLDRELTNVAPRWDAAFAQWQTDMRAKAADGTLNWRVIRPESSVSSGGATLTLLDDASTLASGTNPEKDAYTITFQPGIGTVTGVRLETLTHESLDKKSLSRGGGNFVLTHAALGLLRSGQTNPEPVELKDALSDFSQSGYPVRSVIEDKNKPGWAVSGHEKTAEHMAVFQLRQSLKLEAGDRLVLTLKHESEYKHHNIGRYRIATTDVDGPGVGPTAVPEDVLSALAAATPSPEQTVAIQRHFLAVSTVLDPVRQARVDTVAARDKLLASVPRCMMVSRVEPRPIRILPRGNWMNDSGEIVEPWPPEFLAGPASSSASTNRSTRLDLANFLVTRSNPLTARVFVNRLWKLFFGTGLSKRQEDVGLQGEFPVHPELLDWLAAEFMDSGWDVKHMVRLIVTSQTYRQSSDASPDAVRRDPYNRLLSHQSPFRLDAEFIRDTAMAVSGLLDLKVGGPSVKPYQPAGYWDQLNFPKRTWENDHGDAIYRRGLYTFWCRSFLHPSLQAFDACPREESTADRTPSNTPLQALALLNDPSYVEAARCFAERVMREGGSKPPARLRWAFQQALDRAPKGDERRLMLQLFERELTRFKSDSDGASKLSGLGEFAKAGELDPAELAAWTSVTRSLLNLHETITRF